jgi:sulfate adenylyltransferase subunit 1 (EFTu-like GTPase family)
VLVAINKMDLVDYSRAVYDRIVEDYRAFAQPLGFESITFVPLSAFKGDNVTEPSPHTGWYRGPTLMGWLETVPVDATRLQQGPLRFPVQWVNRPNLDFRGYAGTLTGGRVTVGERIRVQPSGRESTVRRISTHDGDLDVAVAGDAITLVLADEIDISRGDMIIKRNNPPQVSQDLEAMICWFSNKPMPARAKVLLRHTTREMQAIVSEVKYLVDINTLHKIEEPGTFAMNDIGRITLRTAQPVIHDSYRRNRQTGSFILIDPGTNETVAAGMII